MKLISFDVGIKNLAFCILDCSQTLCISDWNVLNLMDVGEPTSYVCSCENAAKSKKRSPTPCKNNAKYSKQGSLYCEKHAKSNTQFILPTKQTSLPNLKKLKMEDLIKQGRSHNLFLNVENLDKLKKADLFTIVSDFFQKQCFEPIKTIKSKTATETDLITIGKNMKDKLNQLQDISGITHAIIENQISPIANRMKTIQGMLAQYFIMVNSVIDIEFVSSVHKLRQFSGGTKVPTAPPSFTDNNLKNTLKVASDSSQERDKGMSKASEEGKGRAKKPVGSSLYGQNKTNGITYCSQILDKNPRFSKHKELFLSENKKKDDLADCFLQGLWYLSHKNKITFADDLNIKLVTLS